MLARSVVQGFGGKARFVSENYGDSALAKKHGVTRYPAIFVGDVLVATPKDFGFFGKGEGPDVGRYAPLKSAASHDRFRADLTRMIELLLAGRKEAARRVPAPGRADAPVTLPDLSFTDLDGKTVTRASLAGRPVLVELWATWCPPCRGTLAWLAELKRKHGDRLAVVGVAVESAEAEVRKAAAKLDLPFPLTIGTPELVRALGDVSAVPTLLLFDGEGRAKATFFGAPPTLHGDVESALAPLLPARR